MQMVGVVRIANYHENVMLMAFINYKWSLSLFCDFVAL